MHKAIKIKLVALLLTFVLLHNYIAVGKIIGMSMDDSALTEENPFINRERTVFI